MRRTLAASHPLATAALAGAFAGLLAAVLLLLADFAAPTDGREDGLLYSVGYWAGIPANEWLRAVTRGDWGWEGHERAQFVALSLMLSGAFWGAAAFGVAGGLKRSRRFRRLLAVCAAITLPLAAAQWAVGIPGPMGGESRLQDGLLITHAPGIFLLQQVGLCCGYFNSTVLRDWGGSYRPSALPVFLLAASNLVMYLAMWYAGVEVRRRMTRRRDRARAAAPVAPG
jgi:hypothetical protein